MMKIVSRILAAVVIVTLLPSTTLAADEQVIPNEFIAVVPAAERDGSVLFEAAKNQTESSSPMVTSAKSRISDFCDMSYRPVAILHPMPVIYFLGEVSPTDGLVYGRHYKVSGDVVTLSTKSCIVSPVGPEPSKASVVTHLLSPTPTEFHVYLSLKANRPIYVGTNYGIWAVKNGKIGLVQKRAEA